MPSLSRSCSPLLRHRLGAQLGQDFLHIDAAGGLIFLQLLKVFRPQLFGLVASADALALPGRPALNRAAAAEQSPASARPAAPASSSNISA